MSHWPIESLLLLDEMMEAEPDRMLCRRTVRAGGLFDDGDGDMPAWCGLELMAQCAGVWAGWQARIEQRPLRLGFLLGTRHYRCDADAFFTHTAQGHTHA